MNVVRLVDLAKVNTDTVENVALANALILGPAVVALLEDVQMDGVNFGCGPGGIESVLIEVPEGATVAGVVGLRHVRLVGCTLHHISFIGTRDTLAMIRAALAGAAVDTTVAPPSFYGHLLKTELPNEENPHVTDTARPLHLTFTMLPDGHVNPSNGARVRGDPRIRHAARRHRGGAEPSGR